MRPIVDWKRLKTIVPYSRQHITRLEKTGQFPSRVRLGQCRVGWYVDEIEDWLNSRPRARLDDNAP
jgi:prophage regulatory protein